MSPLRLFGLYLIIFLNSEISAQSFKNGMREFHFLGAEDTRKGAWDKKRLPVSGPAVYTGQNNWKWVGNYENGHLNGSFYVLDERGYLLLEGEAKMDTIVRGTQYLTNTWTERVVLDNGAAIGKNHLITLPIYSGSWKNRKWYSGRQFTYRQDDYSGPKQAGYIEAIFDETGSPSLAIYEYAKKDVYFDSTYYLYSFKDRKNGTRFSYRVDGSLQETCLYDSLTADLIIKEIYFPPTNNTEGIAWMEAPAGNYPSRYNFGSFFEYPDGKTYHEIKGWLHIQYKDGRCSKVLYDMSGKPIPGARWDLPATSSGIRPDSLNFSAIAWKGGNYYGSVLNGLPNGWGRWLKEGNNRVIEGYFAGGEPKGIAAEMQGYRYARDKYFAVLQDGQVNTNFKILDPEAEVLERKRQEAALRESYAALERLNKPTPLPGPKRIISWNASEGTVTWSDYTITRGKQIPPMEVKAGMIMMHQNRIQVVQYAPMASLRTIVYYGNQKINSYTWSPNVQTVTIYPELEPFKSSFIGQCSNCMGKGKTLLRVYNGQGDQLYNYKGVKQIQHNYYHIYEPALVEGKCATCEGSGITPRQ